MLRGAWGHALRQSSCITKQASCKGCPVRPNCAYSVTFEPAPPSDEIAHASSTSSAAAYILSPPSIGVKNLLAGELIEFGLTLIGPAIEYLTTIEDSFRQAMGFFQAPNFLPGSLRLRKVIAAPVSDAWPSISTDGSNRVDGQNNHYDLKFLTPLRLQRKGKIVRDVRHLFARDIVIAAVKRVAQIRETVLRQSCADIDFQSLAKLSEAVAISGDMQWHELSRFSNRQRHDIPLGGLLGTIKLKGDLHPFLPYLRSAEVLHLGKETSFGLGSFQFSSKP